MNENAIIEPQFLPPINCFAVFNRFSQVIIDDLSLFQKQTYRNRAHILGPNHIQKLIVSVKKGKSKTAVGELKIDYSEDWCRIHKLAIQSAYANAAFYDYYAEAIFEVIESRAEKLIDLNMRLSNLLIKLIGIDCKLVLLSDLKELPERLEDFRNQIHPKKPQTEKSAFFRNPEYFQVFSDRFPFQPNLSIIDLLFNMGPETKSYFLQSARD